MELIADTYPEVFAKAERKSQTKDSVLCTPTYLIQETFWISVYQQAQHDDLNIV